MSQERDKIQISISKCTGLPTWRTDAEINSVLNSMFVGFAIADYYFDIDDYSSPLKVNARNDITFIPTSGFTKVVNVKVRTNIVEDHPSPYPFSNSHSYEYYSVGEIVREVALSQNGQILQITFTLDNEYLQMSRSVYSLADMVGQVGGFGGMLISIFSFVVGVISTKVYQQSIMSEIYQVNSNEDNSKRTTSNRIFHEEIKQDHSKKRSISFHTEYNLK